jgi:MoaD family protein
MKVTLKYMGQLRHLTGKNEEQIECSEGSSLTDLLTKASGKYDPHFVDIVLDSTGTIRPSLIIIINGITASKDAAPNLSDGDTITLLTAIAGG